MSQGGFCGPIHARCNSVIVFRIHALSLSDYHAIISDICASITYVVLSPFLVSIFHNQRQIREREMFFLYLAMYPNMRLQQLHRSVSNECPAYVLIFHLYITLDSQAMQIFGWKPG